MIFSTFSVDMVAVVLENRRLKKDIDGEEKAFCSRQLKMQAEGFLFKGGISSMMEQAST
jgi:hypothetical protein